MIIQMYNYPHLYDMCTGHKVDDIPFYEYWTKETGGTILELACGTGRLAGTFLDKRYNYTGLDLSSVFIDHCKRKYSKGQFITGDMRSFKLDQKFNLIFIPFNSFLHLYYEEEMLQCLKSARNHLKREGRFLLDIFVPDPEFLYRDPDKKYKEINIVHPEGGDCIVWQKSKFDEESEINQIRWLFDRGKGREQDEYKFDMRMIYPDTMDRLLMDSGFTIEEKWGNYDGDPFDETSFLQLYICSKNMEWVE